MIRYNNILVNDTSQQDMTKARSSRSMVARLQERNTKNRKLFDNERENKGVNAN